MSIPARGARNRPLHRFAAVDSPADAQPARRRHGRRTQQTETDVGGAPFRW
uniref:Uncharacterized protein n=1 Tax=Arundo donax TaxID=35708 RepID=A0A0A9FCC5_ARUDO